MKNQKLKENRSIVITRSHSVLNFGQIVNTIRRDGSSGLVRVKPEGDTITCSIPASGLWPCNDSIDRYDMLIDAISYNKAWPWEQQAV